MEQVRDLALAYATAQTLDLPRLLAAEARDWHIVDSTTVRLPDELIDDYPGTGEYAALKIHKRFSVGLGTRGEAVGFMLGGANPMSRLI